MMLARSLVFCLGFLSLATGTILQNGQARLTDYPDTVVDASTLSLKTYPPNSPEISYKGRWDSKFVSWWSAPGIKFGYTGQTVVIEFGNLTDQGVLVGYRIAGLDWMFSNITAGASHLLVSPDTYGSNLTGPISPTTFELRVTNWQYGVQIESVSVAAGQELVQVPEYGRRIEFIGDSLEAGAFTSYEGLSGVAYGIGEGLGNTEYSVTAYPGICAADVNCWSFMRGQEYQWFYTADPSPRASAIWGNTPQPWDFAANPAADLVIINLGTNDIDPYNDVSGARYTEALTHIIEGVHGVWPSAQVIVMSLWMGFNQSGNTFFSTSSTGYEAEILNVTNYFNSAGYPNKPIYWNGTTGTTTTSSATSQPFVHYFNTKGILQHNDIGPQAHPTDFGAAKIAAHMIRYINIVFNWVLYATGPEVVHDTLYWNDEASY